MDMVHLMEFLDIRYEMDVASLNSRYQDPLRGSHLLLFSPPGGEPFRGLQLRPGLYEVGTEDRAIRFVKDATGYGDMENDNTFVLIDGPPNSRTVENPGLDPLCRLCHLLFPYPVSDEKGCLSDRAALVLDWIYERPAGMSHHGRRAES